MLKTNATFPQYFVSAATDLNYTANRAKRSRMRATRTIRFETEPIGDKWLPLRNPTTARTTAQWKKSNTNKALEHDARLTSERVRRRRQ